MNVVGKNIVARLRDLGLTQPQLAELTGLSQVAIHKIVTGKTKRTGFLSEIAAALDCTVEDLISPAGVDRYKDAGSGAVKADREAGLVPLLSWPDVVALCESGQPLNVASVKKWLDLPALFPEGRYCLIMIGDSMYAEDGYRDGETVMVDPEGVPEHGDDVVTLMPGGRCALRRLQVAPDGSYLVALNPHHPGRKTEMSIGARICGVVTASWTRRK